MRKYFNNRSEKKSKREKNGEEKCEGMGENGERIKENEKKRKRKRKGKWRKKTKIRNKNRPKKR